MSIVSRKNDHIQICLDQDVQSEVTTGFERYRLEHKALPEGDFADVSLDTEFLGKHISAPVLISSMTGGTKNGDRINRSLLEAANELNIPFAFGSLRIYLEETSARTLEKPRKIAPDVPILANLGAVQLNYDFTRDDCLRMVEIAEADALYLHLNPLQEIFQIGGNTNFAELLPKIDELCSNFPVPVLVKEVGGGISASDARKLTDAGIFMIDVAGAGGTSWVKVEKAADGRAETAALAAPFLAWGIPTAQCIEQIHAQYPDIRLIASGGITNGVEVWKALLLGAEMAGVARILLEPALTGTEATVKMLKKIISQTRIAKFVSDTVLKIS